MVDPKNLALESIRNRQRPTVDRSIDPLTPEPLSLTSMTSAVSAESEVPLVVKPVKRVRRTLRVDSDANELIKAMLGRGGREISIDVLVEALLVVVSEQPEDLKNRVIEVAKNRAQQRREKSLQVREQNKKNKSS